MRLLSYVLVCILLTPSIGLANRKAEDERMAFKHGYCSAVQLIAELGRTDEREMSAASNWIFLRQASWWLARAEDWAGLDLDEFDSFRGRGESAAFDAMGTQLNQPLSYFTPTLDACFESAVDYVLKYNESDKSSLELLQVLLDSRVIRGDISQDEADNLYSCGQLSCP